MIQLKTGIIVRTPDIVFDEKYAVLWHCFNCKSRYLILSKHIFMTLSNMYDGAFV